MPELLLLVAGRILSQFPELAAQVSLLKVRRPNAVANRCYPSSALDVRCNFSRLQTVGKPLSTMRLENQKNVYLVLSDSVCRCKCKALWVRDISDSHGPTTKRRVVILLNLCIAAWFHVGLRV